MFTLNPESNRKYPLDLVNDVMTKDVDKIRTTAVLLEAEPRLKIERKASESRAVPDCKQTDRSKNRKFYKLYSSISDLCSRTSPASAAEAKNEDPSVSLAKFSSNIEAPDPIPIECTVTLAAIRLGCTSAM